MQFAEEGAAKVFKPMIGSGFIVGVVGALQFEVLASRIEIEYGCRCGSSRRNSPAPAGFPPQDKVEALPTPTNSTWRRTMTAIWSIPTRAAAGDIDRVTRATSP